MTLGLVMDYLKPHRLADGSFPRYVHGSRFGVELGTVHGDQFLPAWHTQPRLIGYRIDDFGNSKVILSEDERQYLRGYEEH
jgi:hypothetical protein